MYRFSIQTLYSEGLVMMGRMFPCHNFVRVPFAVFCWSNFSLCTTVVALSWMKCATKCGLAISVVCSPFAFLRHARIIRVSSQTKPSCHVSFIVFHPSPSLCIQSSNKFQWGKLSEGQIVKRCSPDFFFLP